MRGVGVGARLERLDGALGRRLEEAAADRILWGEGNRVQGAIEPAPAAIDLGREIREVVF